MSLRKMCQPILTTSCFRYSLSLTPLFFLEKIYLSLKSGRWMPPILPVPEKNLCCNEPLDELTCIIPPSPVNFLVYSIFDTSGYCQTYNFAKQAVSLPVCFLGTASYKHPSLDNFILLISMAAPLSFGAAPVPLQSAEAKPYASLRNRV